MGVLRKWYCSCTGMPRELEYDAHLEEASDPVCPRCGASPSSDPKHSISFHDQEEWDD
jgi:hypothetical protein